MIFLLNLDLLGLTYVSEEHLKVEELTKQNQTTFLETVENNDHDNVRLFKFTLESVGI